MRDMANMANDHPKWIVLDGDIDPMWIESLNTVMDDNKVENSGLAKKYTGGLQKLNGQKMTCAENFKCIHEKYGFQPCNFCKNP